jgi:RNA polymerase sigma-70 factor (ECF subfamily)
MSSDPPPSATPVANEMQLAAAAAGGDRVALERLLLAHYDDLTRRIRPKLPVRLQSTQAVEDILQQTFLQAFRDIRKFEARPGASFGDWLHRIAEHRLLDAIKQHDRVKRGGDLVRVESSPNDSCLMPLLDWLAGSDPHPSSEAARAEALGALHVALAGLEPDQRDAVRLRLLEGLSLEETAAQLQRTPDAVRGLVHRGKLKLRDAMGRASQWLSAK